MEFEIIDFVKSNPLLYERKYNNNKSRPHKMEKWRELGKSLGRDPNALRFKWRSMRDNYRRQMQSKAKEHRDAEDVIGAAYCSKYYNHMTFLNSEYNDVKTEQDASQSELEEVLYEIVPIDSSRVEIDNVDFSQCFNKFDANTLNTTHIRSTMGVEQAAHQSKKKRDDKDSIVTEACEEMSALLRNAKEHIVPPSHHQVFFNSVALQVEQAQLPAMDQMRLQQKLLELITQELILYQERTYNLQL